MKGKDLLVKELYIQKEGDLQNWLNTEGAEYEIIDIKYAVSHSVMNAGYGSEANYYVLIIYTL